LLDSIGQEDKQGILGLSNLPIIGAFFRSKANRTERTELMVLITPRLVRPLDPRRSAAAARPCIKPGGGRGGGGGNGKRRK
jgi:Flp pilus assembly secretin CpaC